MEKWCLVEQNARNVMTANFQFLYENDF